MTTPEGLGKRAVLGAFAVTEEATLRMAESAMSNYRDANLALMDLVDNGVDNRIMGQLLSIYVRVNRDYITVRNTGGEGLDLEGFQNYLRWGISTKRGQIGQYGVGGKAAMGFLGKSIEITASARGSDVEYYLSDPHWGEKQEVSQREHTAQIRQAENTDGYFNARVTELNSRRIDTKTIRARLGDTYRPLLDSGAVRILVNGQPVLPLEIKYMESDANFKPERKRLGTGFGEPINIKVGILDEGQKVRPGLRCYYRGRLIEDGEFFGMPTSAQLPQASRLIGEVHLDHLDVTMNKSDFIKDVKWEDAVLVIRQQVLEGWYQKLNQLSIESTFRLESYEKIIARDAKRAFEHILSTTQLITRKTLPGSSTGRLAPTPDDSIRPPSTGKTRNVGDIEGATAPRIDATKAPTYKRWGALHSWEPVSMGNPFIRSEIITENDREIVKINIDFPLYQAAKKAGRDALLLYQVETAILEICEREYPQLTPAEFITRVNELMGHLGKFYFEDNSYGNRASKGSINNFQRPS